MVEYVSEMERLLEAALIRSKQDMYGVYRLKGLPELDARRGKSLYDLQAGDNGVCRKDYFLCYIGPLGTNGWVDTIRQQLYRYKPLDFPGAPPDTGDIIVLQIEGSLTAHYLNEYDSFDVLHDFMEASGELRNMIAVTQIGVEYGHFNRRTVPGYILENGAVLLDGERDAAGNYYGGAGLDGMYLKTGEMYRPVIGNGRLTGFIKL